MALRERKIVSCPTCKGSKKVNGKNCPTCSGEGQIVERVSESGLTSQTKILNE